jgi:uncharacterized protein (TIGR03437 family)
VQVPIANAPYRTYIDGLIQRAKKYGNYVLVVKAGQFPDAPCGADGKTCPAINQGDLNCQANTSVCFSQDTTGNNIDPAFNFWASFAKTYASDPAVLYDTWEDMHGIDNATWSNNQNELIAAIRTYAPQSLIFMEDVGNAFDSIVGGTLSGFYWPNLVWNFHIYTGSTGACIEPASPRYANWPQNIDALVSHAHANGRAVAFSEWGGCNDPDPYHANITQYAQSHAIALVYFDSSVLFTANRQLTAIGSKVAQAYAGTGSGGPSISLVANAEGEVTTIAPNTWVEIKGSNLAPASATRIWQDSDFVNGQLPTQLDGVSVTVNSKSAFVYYISPTQVNVLTPPDALPSSVQVIATNNGTASAAFSVAAQGVSPSFFVFNGGPYVIGTHVNGSLLGPTSLYQGLTTPAKPGETVVLYANGFGAVPVGTALSPLPVIGIGGAQAVLQFAGLISPGLFQFNVVVPSSASDGDLPIIATYNGASTQSGTLITVQH